MGLMATQGPQGIQGPPGINGTHNGGGLMATTKVHKVFSLFLQGPPGLMEPMGLMEHKVQQVAQGPQGPSGVTFLNGTSLTELIAPM